MGEPMGDIGFIRKSDLEPRRGDTCGECRERGLDICQLDEICQERLAEALGKEPLDLGEGLHGAMEKGLLQVRWAKARGRRMRFVKLSEEGRLLFGVQR